VIAVQLYTVRDQLQEPSRIADVLIRLREIGYRAVEVAGLAPNTVAHFGKMLKQAGLIACAAHVSLNRVKGDLERVVAECHEWGCEYVVIPSLPDDYRSREGYNRFATEAVELADRLHSHGLQLAYHNHAFELERYGEQTGLEAVLGGASDGAIQAEFDTYWLQYGGVDPADWIRRFKHRVPLVHLKDMVIDRGHPVDAEVGEGNMNWLHILDACREAGTRWLVVEQDAPRRDPMESVAISHANLTKLIDAVGWES